MSTRRLRFNRFGLKEDPRGRTIAEPLLTIVEVYIQDRGSYLSPSLMLRTRHFDGSDGPDINAYAAVILDDDVGTLTKEGFLE